MTTEGVILFDGECGLCSRTVRFVARRDPKGRFRFASLQSTRGRELLERHGLDPDRQDAMVLITEGRAYQRSGAALRVARGLSGVWPLLAGLLAVPRALRDAVYSFVAERRHRWFKGPREPETPDRDLADRFL